MKIVVVAIVLLSSQTLAAVCDSTVLTGLVKNTHTLTCAKDSGYNFAAATKPDQPTIDKMCSSIACDNFLRDTKAMDLEECQLPLGPGINLMGDLIDYVPPKCPPSSIMGSASDTPPANDAPSTTDASTNETRSTPLTPPTATSTSVIPPSAC